MSSLLLYLVPLAAGVLAVLNRIWIPDPMENAFFSTGSMIVVTIIADWFIYWLYVAPTRQRFSRFY